MIPVAMSTLECNQLPEYGAEKGTHCLDTLHPFDDDCPVDMRIRQSSYLSRPGF